MDHELRTRLAAVGDAFRLPGEMVGCEQLKKGNVNCTYLVTYADGGRRTDYLFQKVNTYAFRQPVQLMENADKITGHIRKKHPDAMTLQFYHTERDGRGQNYVFEGDNFWRVMNFIPSVTFMSCDNTEVVRNAGIAFGDFQTALSDFDPHELYYTIPGFHDTRKRYADLKASVETDPAGRRDEVKDELAFLLSVENQACLPIDLYNAGKLPLRVTHNDTKINNVLFDEHTLKPLVVIDLDTVMPGIIGSDFGDAIRYAANFTEEDCDAYDKVGIDMRIFEAFADGFLSRTAGSLTETEIETLVPSCFSIACELATRFLGDYLDGDLYFRTDYPTHNLVRARNQIALAKDMARHTDAMNATVHACVAKYCS